jgi:succinate dehydrogenase / fumarate reductase membrane anchor subunit
MLSGQSAPPRGSFFESLAWRYMRWSGVLLIPLAFVHLGIMHIINSVYDIDYHWVIERRWAFLGWRIYDAFLLWFAGLHGYNGLRYVINDYVQHSGVKRGLQIAGIVVLIFVLAVGTIALIGAPLQSDPAIPRESLRMWFRL